MQLYKQSSAVRARLFFMIIISMMCMTVDYQFRYLQPLRDALTWVLSPIEFSANLPTKMGDATYRSVRDRQNLLDENEQLRKNNMMLQAAQQRLQSLHDENQRLRELLHSSKRVDTRVLVSELLSMDLDPFRQQVKIDKGKLDDVFVGQPVIDALGIMGQVSGASQSSAVVLLISDPNHLTPVEIMRNGLRTIAVGSGKTNLLKLRYLPPQTDIEVGDTVVTSGLGSRFPPDYPVAEIIEIIRTPGEPFMEVFAEPKAHLDRAREVMLVWPSESKTISTKPLPEDIKPDPAQDQPSS